MGVHEVVITDVTRMAEQRICVAGYVLDSESPPRCVRPLFRFRPMLESWLVRKGLAVVRPFHRVELDLLQPLPHPPHIEDWIVDDRHRLPRGGLSTDGRRTLLRTLDDGAVDCVFGAPVQVLSDRGGAFVAGGSGMRSLGTIRVAEVRTVTYSFRPRFGKWNHRLTFVDDDDQTYNLPVTDLAYRYFLDLLRDGEDLSPGQVARHLHQVLGEAEDLYLRIGLARGWGDHPDRCHLQINGVYTFPDFLDGRCSVDLAPRPPALDLSDVPF